MQSFQISDENVGLRLDRFLYSQIGTVSRMFLADLIANSSAFINGEPNPAVYKLQKGDRIEISFDESAETAMTPENISLDILFEDAEILVVNKPAGMLVHPTKRVKTGTLANALAFYLNRQIYECGVRNAECGIEKEENSSLTKKVSEQTKNSALIRPGLVHRLDKETSGLMVVAKTERALRILSGHFQRKLIEKKYLAAVENWVVETEGKIIAPIGRIENEKPHWRVLENGKAAETRFRVLERRENTTLLELEPVTGRTNQL